jgi:hypothetical protein
MTDPRQQWILDRLAEDEATAKAAAAHDVHWHVHQFQRTASVMVARSDEDHPRVAVAECAGCGAAEHIATWDPARALSTVAALRQILELHKPVDIHFGVICADTFKPDVHEPWPCPTVRAVASIWADRPGHQEVWADA